MRGITSLLKNVKVGGSLSPEELELVKNLSFNQIEPKTKKAEKLLDSYIQKINQRYPDMQSRLEDLVEFSSEKYEYLPTESTDLKEGDICVNSDYGVKVPPAGKVSAIFNTRIEETRKKRGINKIISYTIGISRDMPHAFGVIGFYSAKTYNALSSAKNYLLHFKKMSLEDSITGYVPPVCFEQALALACLLSEDEDIKRLGGKAHLTGGMRFERGYFNRSKGVHHAWVRLDFKDIHPEEGIDSHVYILDPAFKKVFSYDPNYTGSRIRYIHNYAGADFLFREKSTKDGR
jgi:hypothetical protein